MKEVSPLFAFTDGDVWRLGIGDPTIMGWLTVVAYFIAAVMCFRCVRRAARFELAREVGIFWGILTALLVFLGINKQLDLQTFLTLTVRRVAIAQGWYDYRRVSQAIFVVVIATAGILSVIRMRGLVRRHSELWLPLVGFVLLLAFVVIRAASFHHVDEVINFRWTWVRMNWVLEIGAIAVVAFGTVIPQRNVEAGSDERSEALLPAR